MGQSTRLNIQPAAAIATAASSGRPGADTLGNSRRPERKVRATFHLPAQLFDECRDAVVYLSGPPVRLTLAALAEEALGRELARLKRKHNSSKRFPRRVGELRGGRPIGT
jgi:hypothetical protein